MTDFKNTEFSITGNGTTVMVMENQQPRIFTEQDADIIKKFFQVIEERYPKAFKALREEYGHLPNFKYRAVRRFIKCNWGKDDEILDIDEQGRFNFEHVWCPLRGGDCPWEDTICHPIDATNLSEREIEIVKLYAEGYSTKEIALQLDISVKTVESHKDNIFNKLNVNKITQVVTYAHKRKLV